MCARSTRNPLHLLQKCRKVGLLDLPGSHIKAAPATITYSSHPFSGLPVLALPGVLPPRRTLGIPCTRPAPPRLRHCWEDSEQSVHERELQEQPHYPKLHKAPPQQQQLSPQRQQQQRLQQHHQQHSPPTHHQLQHHDNQHCPLPSQPQQRQQQHEDEDQECRRRQDSEFRRLTLGNVPLEGLPEGLAKKRMRELIALRRRHRQHRGELIQSLFSSSPWMKELRQTTAALYKKDDILQQLRHLVLLLEHAESEEGAHNSRLRLEFEEIYAQYQDQHDQLTAQLEETPLVTQEVNFMRSQKPHKMTRHPVYDGEASSSSSQRARYYGGQGGEDLSSSRVLHDFRAAGTTSAPSLPHSTTQQQQHHPKRCLYREEMTKVVDRPKLICTMPATQMLRTVYMPNEHADLLVLTLESLTMQLNDQEKICDQKARLMSEMRHTRSLEHKKRVLVNKDAIKMLKKGVRLMKTKAMERNRTIVMLQQQLVKQTAEMERERLFHTSELISCNNLREHALTELQKKQSASNTQFESYKQTMNAESKTRNNQFDELKLRYRELQRLYKTKIDSLDAELGRERKKLLMLQEQRKFVVEQLARQVATLRDGVRALQMEARVLSSSSPRFGLDDWLTDPSMVPAAAALPSAAASRESPPNQKETRMRSKNR